MTGMIKSIITWPARKALSYVFLAGGIAAAGGGALMGTQYPKFMQVYQQRLGGYAAAVAENCKEYQEDADERTGGDLGKLLEVYRREESTRFLRKAEREIPKCRGGTSEIEKILQSQDASEKGIGFFTYHTKAAFKDIQKDLGKDWDYIKDGKFKQLEFPWPNDSPDMRNLSETWKNYKIGFPELQEPGLLAYSGIGALAGIALYMLGLSALKGLWNLGPGQASWLHIGEKKKKKQGKNTSGSNETLSLQEQLRRLPK